MRYHAEFIAEASAERVFDAFHRYKEERDPTRFFPTLVDWEFDVATENVLGLGARYRWKIGWLGREILNFTEEVVEWERGRAVSYRAVEGWTMDFRVGLCPLSDGTAVAIDFQATSGRDVVDRWLRPVVEAGLGWVCRRGLAREGIITRSVGVPVAYSRDFPKFVPKLNRPPAAVGVPRDAMPIERA